MILLSNQSNVEGDVSVKKRKGNDQSEQSQWEVLHISLSFEI